MSNEEMEDGRDGVPLFDPQLCASLHNKLVQNACKADPRLLPKVQRGLFSLSPGLILDDSDPRQQIAPAEIRERLGSELNEFLDFIDVYPQDTRQPFTPICVMPHLPYRWQFAERCSNDGHSCENAILLYQNNGWRDVDTTGGLFFDPHTQLARWFDMDLNEDTGNQDDWIPLDVVLSRWINLWETGRFISLGDVAEWIESDVDAAVNAWNGLLDAVESRCGREAYQPDLTPIETMLDYDM